MLNEWLGVDTTALYLRSPVHGDDVDYRADAVRPAHSCNSQGYSGDMFPAMDGVFGGEEMDMSLVYQNSDILYDDNHWVSSHQYIYSPNV